MSGLNPTAVGRGPGAQGTEVKDRGQVPAERVGPVPSSPTRAARFGLTAIKVIDQQNLYLLSHTCLFLSLAWRGRISVARSSA